MRASASVARRPVCLKQLRCGFDVQYPERLARDCMTLALFRIDRIQLQQHPEQGAVCNLMLAKFERCSRVKIGGLHG